MGLLDCPRGKQHHQRCQNHLGYDDIARLEYGQRIWQHVDMRCRLLAHWQDECHPHRERFTQHREQVELALNSNDTDEALNRHSLTQGTSLRYVAWEIQPVFGHFFAK